MLKAGTLVRCNCKADTWYKGLVGTVVGFDHFGKFRTDGVGDPLVMFGSSGATMRMARSGLEIL